jgi:hypothetical protein
MRSAWLAPVVVALLTSLLLPLPAATAETSPWEAPDPPPRTPRPFQGKRLLADEYAKHGRIEEAVAQYLEILAQHPDDAGARARVTGLVTARMPRWLPAEAEQAAPFERIILEYDVRRPGARAQERGPRKGTRLLQGRTESPGQSMSAATEPEGELGGGRSPGADPASRDRYRLLVTQAVFAARETERWDEVHEEECSHIDYAYVWDGVKKQWVMRARVHWTGEDGATLAWNALRAALAFYCVAKSYLGADPTQPWADPIDIWLLEEGEPGARALGASIYLYAVKTPRPEGEWLREVSHEYGHVCLPGIGGFTETDDPWADGHMAELLFAKWLAHSGPPQWLPWSAGEGIREAAVERERLIAKVLAIGADEEKLQGVGEEARDYFLGLALHVEETAGPTFLAQVLSRCVRGRPAQFVAAASRLGSETGEAVWRGLKDTAAE